MKRSSIVPFALILAACSFTQPQTPYRFTVAPAEGEPVDVVARHLASEGHSPANVDKELGIVQTQWQDTGFGYGFVNGVGATIVRRFTVTIARTANGSDIVLRADQQRCQRGNFIIDDTGVRGTCVAMDEVVERGQKEIDELGARLRTVMSGR